MTKIMLYTETIIITLIVLANISAQTMPEFSGFI